MTRGTTQISVAIVFYLNVSPIKSSCKPHHRCSKKCSPWTGTSKTTYSPYNLFHSSVFVFFYFIFYWCIEICSLIDIQLYRLFINSSIFVYKNKLKMLSNCKCKLLSIKVSSIRTLMLIQGRIERMETNLIHLIWGSVWIVTSFH